MIRLTIFLLFTNLIFSQTFDKDYLDGTIIFKLNNYVEPNVDTLIMKSDNIGLEDDLNDYPKIKNIFIDINVVNFERPSYFTSKRELQKIYRITFNEFNQIDNLISKLNKLDNVVYAEKEPIYKTTYIPDDTYHYGTNKWYHSQVNSEQAWDISLGSESVKIAIVDNAIATEHLDLNVLKKEILLIMTIILLLQEPIMKINLGLMELTVQGSLLLK